MRIKLLRQKTDSSSSTHPLPLPTTTTIIYAATQEHTASRAARFYRIFCHGKTVDELAPPDVERKRQSQDGCERTNNGSGRWRPPLPALSSMIVVLFKSLD